MNKQIKVEVALIIVFLLTFVALGYLIYIAKTDGATCLINPLVYGLKQAENSANAEMMCTCSFNDPKYSSLILDNKGLRSIEELSSLSSSEFIITPNNE